MKNIILFFSLVVLTQVSTFAMNEEASAQEKGCFVCHVWKDVVDEYQYGLKYVLHIVKLIEDRIGGTCRNVQTSKQNVKRRQEEYNDRVFYFLYLQNR